MKKLRRAFVVIVLLAIAGLAGWQVLRVREVSVVGLERSSPNDIMMIAGVNYGDSIFGANVRGMRGRIDSSVYFDVQDVSYSFPGKFVITLREHVPAAYLECAGSFVLVDREAMVLSAGSEEGAQGLVRLTGLGVAAFRIGARLDMTEGQLTSVSAVLEAFCTDGGYPITELNAAAPTNVRVLTQEGVTVTLGTVGEIGEKLRWVRAVMEEVNRTYTPEQIYGCTLDVSSGTSAVFALRQ